MHRQGPQVSCVQQIAQITAEIKQATAQMATAEAPKVAQSEAPPFDLGALVAGRRNMVAMVVMG